LTEPLRVSFCLANSGIGGTELNAVRTAERLDRDRFDLEVISLADYPPLRERYETARIPFHVIQMPSLASPQCVRQGWRLARHLRRRRTSVFHAHDSYGNLFGVPWARIARVPTVIASRRWWKSRPRPGHTAGNRAVFKLAHGVLTNTPAVADLTAAEGVPRDKIRVVPNFLDEDSFTAPTDQRGCDLRGELGIPAGAPVIGIIAQLRPEKDHATLIRASARLLERQPEAHIVLVGEGECRPELETLREDLGLSGHVHLTGLRHGEGNLHHVFDISVLCSRTEALSNSILEAMAAGNPVVASDVGGNPDPVRDGETGLLFPVGHVEALANALDRLLTDPAEARRLGDGGRRVARNEYTVAAALAALETTYRSLLSASGHPVEIASAYAA